MTMGPTKEFVESTLKLSQECLGDSAAGLEQKRLKSTVAEAETFLGAVRSVLEL